MTGPVINDVATEHPAPKGPVQDAESPLVTPCLPLDEGLLEAEAKPSKQELRQAKSRIFDYPTDAAQFFGESFPHRLRWAHAVNSRRKLGVALGTGAHFLEGDVASGKLFQAPPLNSGMPEQQTTVDVGGTDVVTNTGEAVIMAHYPTEHSSDLSFELFISAVIKHNELLLGYEEMEGMEQQCELVGAGDPEPAIPNKATKGANDDHTNICGNNDMESCGRQDSSHKENEAYHNLQLAQQNKENSNCSQSGACSVAAVSVPCQQQLSQNTQRDSCADEAASFAQELDRELDANRTSSGSMLTACVGNRRGGFSTKSSMTKKGIKLDFKQFSCIEPAITYLRDVDAARRLQGHLWLNADVFAGPGALLTPLDAREFVRLCAELLPEAVMSLSWGSSLLSTTRTYTHEMVDRMIELCMSPSVPHLLQAPPAPTADGLTVVQQPQFKTDGDVYLTPVATCRHITFAVAAEYALRSSKGLQRLLESVPGASLTLFSGVGSFGVDPPTVQEIIKTYGRTRCFLDLKVIKPWRNCSHGTCSVQ